MISQSHIEETIEKIFEEIEFTAEPSGLYDPLRYMIEIGGKRLRPRLCLIAYSLFKDEFDSSILIPATGLEVFHCFTLIHDDIMDKSPLRRGVDTIWKKWSEDTAILSGDVMLIDSYKRIARAPENVLGKVLDLFSETNAEVCEGQQYDKEFESRPEVSMEEYMKMIGLKTAVLIACSAKMGAIIGGGSEEDCSKIYDYAYDLGLAFQIADDWLDVYGNVKVFGKPIGGDIINNKKSWLMIKALEKASGAQKAELLAAMDMPIETEEEKKVKFEKVSGIYADLYIGDEAQQEILRLHSRAMEVAVQICGGKGEEILREFGEKLIGRNK